MLENFNRRWRDGDTDQHAHQHNNALRQICHDLNKIDCRLYRTAYRQ